jgi:ketosteroid isomerase-like protein
MFERYTERARRVIFFARYEASQYGSSFIESEHVLLGLLREDPALAKSFTEPNTFTTDIHSEIDQRVIRRKPFSTAIEVPLTPECKEILTLAAEEADEFGQWNVGTEHLLLGILRVENSLAAKLLQARGVTLEIVRQQLAKDTAGGPATAPARVMLSGTSHGPTREKKSPQASLDAFLEGLKQHRSEHLAVFFDEKTNFVDSSGKRWVGREEIESQFATLFAPYAKKNVTSFLEGSYSGRSSFFVASILWKNVVDAGAPAKSMHRMTVVLVSEGEDWVLRLVQVTPAVSP